MRLLRQLAKLFAALLTGDVSVEASANYLARPIALRIELVHAEEIDDA
jgi:hypothetical protein